MLGRGGGGGVVQGEDEAQLCMTELAQQAVDVECTDEQLTEAGLPADGSQRRRSRRSPGPHRYQDLEVELHAAWRQGFPGAHEQSSPSL